MSPIEGEDDFQKRVRSLVSSRIPKFGNAGRKSLEKLFVESTNASSVIHEVRNSWGLQHPPVEALFKFADLISIPHRTIHRTALHEMRERLLKTIGSLDQDALRAMLQETITFISHPELRAVPLAILQKMTTVPAASLRLLGKRKLLHHLPVPLQRQAWLLSDDSMSSTSKNIAKNLGSNGIGNGAFQVAIGPICAQIMEHLAVNKPTKGSAAIVVDSASYSSQRTRAINQLLHIILGTKGSNEVPVADSQILFSKFSFYCLDNCLKTGNGSWGALFRHLLIAVSNTGEGGKVVGSSHLIEVARICSQCSRTGKLEDSHVESIVRLIRNIISSQMTSFTRKARDLGIDDGIQGSRTGRQNSQNKRGNSSVNKLSKILAKKNEFYKRKRSDPPHDLLRPILQDGLTYLFSIDTDRIFHDPVTEELVPGYKDYIPWPMDFRTMQNILNNDNLNTGYIYHSLEAFDGDVIRIFRNCRNFNGPESPYTEYAVTLNAAWKKKVRLIRVIFLIFVSFTFVLYFCPLLLSARH